MPNLENLKKQAKQFLRWHRERHYPVAAQIRAVLPRFHDMTDRQVLEADFKLSDAQELVARQFGFASWEALRAGVDGKPAQADKTGSQPVLLSAEPQLFVADIKASCDFFGEKLGFAVAFTYGEPPFYAQVGRDAVRLNLRLVCEPVFAGDIREREDLLAASITVDDVKRLFLEYRAAGVAFYQLLRTEPWGARTFIVKDIDGNLLLFA
jgi:catechol 2,3-dioxygenase-like lactoylglutathione lyase family enzyme